MAKYTFSATVNYPDDEAETPIFNNVPQGELAVLLNKLIADEQDMTSCLITIVKQKED